VSYWFRAKRYGWGWGLPCTWQGWVVLIAYCVLAVAGIPLVRSSMGPLGYIVYAVLLTIVLLAICWRKGEPPRWRWGGRDL
jgi:hypothetical protein